MKRKLFTFLPLFFGLLLYSEVQARTAIVAYGARSRYASGDFKDWTFDEAPTFGGGFRFGMSGRFSFGLDYMKQKMEGATEHHISPMSDEVIGLAAMLNRDISAWNLTPGVELGGWDEIEAINLHSLTGTLYVSLWPNPESRWAVEPLLGFVCGVAVGENRRMNISHYDPVLFEIVDYIYDDDREHNDYRYLLNGDRREFGLHSIKPLAGMEVALNFSPLRNILITSGARYLYNYGFHIRAGIGLAF